jgi:hypothetical protein
MLKHVVYTHEGLFLLAALALYHLNSAACLRVIKISQTDNIFHNYE